MTHPWLPHLDGEMIARLLGPPGDHALADAAGRALALDLLVDPPHALRIMRYLVATYAQVPRGAVLVPAVADLVRFLIHEGRGDVALGAAVDHEGQTLTLSLFGSRYNILLPDEAMDAEHCYGALYALSALLHPDTRAFYVVMAGTIEGWLICRRFCNDALLAHYFDAPSLVAYAVLAAVPALPAAAPVAALHTLLRPLVGVLRAGAADAQQRADPRAADIYGTLANVLDSPSAYASLADLMAAVEAHVRPIYQERACYFALVKAAWHQASTGAAPPPRSSGPMPTR